MAFLTINFNILYSEFLAYMLYELKIMLKEVRNKR